MKTTKKLRTASSRKSWRDRLIEFFKYVSVEGELKRVKYQEARRGSQVVQHRVANEGGSGISSDVGAANEPPRELMPGISGGFYAFWGRPHTHITNTCIGWLTSSLR